MLVLTGIDVLGIQAYVFASNRLRDAMAASWMVELITSRQSLAQWGVGDEQIVLSAGGNAILEFASVQAARTWTAHYTRWLHDTAPGLEVVVAHRVTESQSLAWALKALQIDLARAKVERIPSAPQLGLSVTASCSITGLPATSVDQGELLSPRIRRLREQQTRARGRWDEFLPKLPAAPKWTAAFPLDLDRMGRSYGDTSTLGIVHVDGNRVGKAIAGWLDRCIENETDTQTVRDEYRAWSEAIIALGNAVLRSLVERVAAAIEVRSEGPALCGTPDELSFALRCEERAVLLPMRPLLLGGDDLTFICDGRIALDLAATALEEFAKHSVPHLGQEGEETTLSACAGVALVKPHAPFHRSYELAEALCASAKRARKEANDSAEPDTGAWLDWHIGTTRPGESVDAIRLRQYQGEERGQKRKEPRLSMRPYPLKSSANRKDWRWLERSVLGPDSQANDSFRGFHRQKSSSELVPNVWSGSRSRVKLLSQLVAEGEDAVSRQLEAWKAIEGAVQLPGGLQDSGFIGPRTPLLDAIELLDLHLRLEPDPRAISSRWSEHDHSLEGC